MVDFQRRQRFHIRNDAGLDKEVALADIVVFVVSDCLLGLISVAPALDLSP